jgi:diguanylate cyclase (GGDEF)-like protein
MLENQTPIPDASSADYRRYLQQLGIFHDVAKALISTLNLDAVLQTIMEKMAEYFRPDTWSLLMTDEAKGELYFAIAVGDASEALKSVRLRIGEGIAGWVARHGKPVLVPDVYHDPRFAKRIDEMTRWQTRSIICIPMLSHDKVLGVIQLVNVDMNGFGDNEMLLLQALADYAAIAIDNARAVETIQALTITDDCTGLYNARHLYKILETEVGRSQRFGYQFTVLFLDIDHFKLVNDNHGHLVGSRLLYEVGYAIKSHLRLIDYAFRYGGDEFIVLLPQTSKEAALPVCQRLLEMFRSSSFIRDQDLNLNVRASIGAATYPDDAQTGHDLIRVSDEMMYQVKNDTRDNIAVAGIGVLPPEPAPADDLPPKT